MTNSSVENLVDNARQVRHSLILARSRYLDYPFPSSFTIHFPQRGDEPAACRGIGAGGKATESPLAGASRLAVHGRRWLTEDVHILLTRADLDRFKADWLGRGYVEVTPGLKAVRDTSAGEKIDFMIAGEFRCTV